MTTNAAHGNRRTTTQMPTYQRGDVVMAMTGAVYVVDRCGPKQIRAVEASVWLDEDLDALDKAIARATASLDQPYGKNSVDISAVRPLRRDAWLSLRLLQRQANVLQSQRFQAGQAAIKAAQAPYDEQLRALSEQRLRIFEVEA